MRIFIFLFMLTMFLCGCDKSALDKLKSDKKYPELAKMWTKERAKNSTLWKEAFDYCNTRYGWVGYRSEKPNCKDVMKEVAPIKITGKLDANPINDSFDFK